jgi:hypothetical protein
MRSLFDDLGSASNNLKQKIKGKMDSSQTLEVNGINLILGDTISEGMIVSFRRIWIYYQMYGARYGQEICT